MAKAHTYVHGYDALESERLKAQAWSVLDLLHTDTRYRPGERILEVGCGTGAQTVTLARNSPESRIVSFDRSAKSLAEARQRVHEADVPNVEFYQADLFALPFAEGSFDHVFVCFVLEHLPNPSAALRVLEGMLKPGGTILVFEGDHGATIFHPDSPWAKQAIDCQVELQRRGGGNPLIGRELFPLLEEAGFSSIDVLPRVVYVDGSRPELIDAFTRRTFTAMIKGVRDAAVAEGLVTAAAFDRGIADLERTAASDGVFYYTFFRGRGVCGRSL